METTSHAVCRQLVALMVAHGVKYAVLSPGSRNAPLLVAFAREKAIRHFVVVDERVAAFMALGMAARTDAPVALVCTSGTAMLNYAPAIAEAYYRHVPLVVVSADRPDEWIDQDDSQTIRQRNIFTPYIKSSYHLPVAVADETAAWYVRRTINEALAVAATPCKGPVHINVPLCEPLCETAVYPAELPCRVTTMLPSQQLCREDIEELSKTFSLCDKVMIFVTLSQPDAELQAALSRLAALPQVVVITETLANLHDERFIPTVDRVLTAIDNSEKTAFAPSLLITLGGSPVSRMMKEFLRRYRPQQHWRIGNEANLIDTMQSLTHRIVAEPAAIINQLAKVVVAHSSDYATLWKTREAEATRLHDEAVAAAPWCDLRAFSLLLPAIPAGTTLHLSNGTSVRYAQLFDTPQVERSYCNRGVSGIEGCTSTALGSACVDDALTLLITGDMSFGYDAGALATGYASPRFKIVVMDNGGGGIFRFIKGPSDLPELEECFEVRRRQPIEGYASLHGFRFFRATDEESLCRVLPAFFAETSAPAILSIETPNETNATILRAYMRRARIIK